jgi:hypothetical protein
MEDDLKNTKKNGRQPQKIMKMEDDLNFFLKNNLKKWKKRRNGRRPQNKRGTKQPKST